MSQSQPAKTKDSSQVPRTRGPRGGSNGSGAHQQEVGDSNEEIPSRAVTSSTSRPQRSGRTQANGRRQSNVTFGPSPSVAPDDSISKIKSRSTWPGPNTNSDRKGSRSARGAWNSYRFGAASRTSSRNGTAWSGSGAALTENNLEQFNEANGMQRSSGGNSNQEPQSNQQEVPQTAGDAARSAYRNRNTSNGWNQQTSGQTNVQASSRRYRAATNRNIQGEGAKSQRRGAGATENNATSQLAVDNAEEVPSGSQSQSKQQTVVASRNVIDTNAASNGASQSKSSAQARSRRDSLTEGNAQKSQGQNAGNSGSSSSKATKPSQTGQSPTSPTSSTSPGGWERKTRIITTRYPDGREIREREITHRPIATA